MSNDQTIESLSWARDLGLKATKFTAVDGKEISYGETAKFVSLEEFADKPYRIRETPRFITVDSFASYYNRFNNPDSLLFASLKGKTVTGKLDYHGVTDPSWSTHSAVLESVVSPEWDAFRKINEKWQSQTEFADFLERWNHVVIEPDAAHISEIALNLEGSTSGKFASRINRHNGNAVLSFEEETSTGTLKVPTKMVVALQPFFNSERVEVLVLLRFRILEGSPKFQMVISNIDRVEFDALQETFRQVEAATEGVVLVGP